MAEPQNDGLFPDSISPSQLRDLLGRAGIQLPVSDLIPALNFKDASVNSGGICDLQYVVIQLIQNSKDGVEFIQLLTLALYMSELCFTAMEGSISEADALYDGPDKLQIIKELLTLKNSFKRALDELSNVHLALMSSASMDRITRLRPLLGDDAGHRDYHSHLLISDSILESLKQTRSDADPFIKANQP
jgi:hypothetical protein